MPRALERRAQAGHSRRLRSRLRAQSGQALHERLGLALVLGSCVELSERLLALSGIERGGFHVSANRPDRSASLGGGRCGRPGTGR